MKKDKPATDTFESEYVSGSPRNGGQTLKEVLKELRKTIKDTLKGKRSSDWFNRDY